MPVSLKYSSRALATSMTAVATAADALGLAGDADGAAADADLHEVSARLCEEAEALGIHDITCAHLHGVAVVLADPADGAALPLG